MPIRRLLAALALLSVPPLAAQEPRSFRDCDACPAMVTVPAGRFVMGMTPDEDKQARGLRENWRKMAEPQHAVTFAKPFAIGKFEVTKREFAASRRRATSPRRAATPTPSTASASAGATATRRADPGAIRDSSRATTIPSCA